MGKKILVLNGSPKNDKSATMVVTKAFVEGLNSNDVEIINVSSLNIKPCLGCLSCWGRTAGECIIKDDDILDIKKKIEEADIIIESYPLYFFSMPGVMKVLTDRLLSMMCTYEGQKAPKNGNSYHGIRNPHQGQKFIIISSCAYSDVSLAYESLLKQYDCICGKNNYTPILVSQLKTLIDLNNDERTNKYLKMFTKAGEEFINNGCLSKETQILLSKPPFSDGAYRVLLANFWEQEKRG